MRLKHIILSMAFVAIGCVSCTITRHSVTDNPVGTKIGVKGAWAGNTMDVSYQSAATAGGITKIGTAEHRIRTFLGFAKTVTILTGE
jgi:hypothetical protein